MGASLRRLSHAHADVKRKKWANLTASPTSVQKEPTSRIGNSAMTQTRKCLFLLITTIVCACQTLAALAEPRHYADGYTIDYEIWLEDARIDPIAYFVYPPKNLGRSNKCSNQVEADPVIEFFHHFNSLVEAGVFDLLDVQLVWAMRECLNNPDMQDVLNVSRNTYFHRLDKIRSTMLDKYE